MSQRIIKFRAFGKVTGIMVDCTPSWWNQYWDEELKENWEIMQFTGLKDKNGKEIYERDIVQSIYWGQPKRAKGIVIFEGYEWKTVPKNRGSHKTSYELWSDVVGEEGTSVEVIGNIYENPELLK